MKQHYL